MAFITIYLDESYSQPPIPVVYTIAGCVSTDGQWSKFQKRWKNVLDRDVLPRWKQVYGANKPMYFHMTDFGNPHSKIYGDWAEERKKKFLNELLKIMKQHSMRRFATSVIHADYDALTNEVTLIIRWWECSWWVV